MRNYFVSFSSIKIILSSINISKASQISRNLSKVMRYSPLNHLPKKLREIPVIWASRYSVMLRVCILDLMSVLISSVVMKIIWFMNKNCGKGATLPLWPVDHKNYLDDWLLSCLHAIWLYI